MTAPAAAPFRFFAAHVVRSVRLGPSMVRISLGGELGNFVSGGRDQSFSLFLPHPRQTTPEVPTDSGDSWFAAWRAMDPAVRGVMRSYTVREQRRDPDELDVDFVLHGDTGPASRWASHARPGDCVTLLGPVAEDNKSVGFRPPPGTDWVLITADETALPAVAGILAWLPPDVPTRVWIEVPHAADAQDLPTRAAAEVTWLVRDSQPHRRTSLLLDAVRAYVPPEGRPYAWIAGESGTVRSIRRHLVGERGFDRDNVKFTGYWRRGASEDDLAFGSPSAIRQPG